MQYWVAMTEEELQASMALLGVGVFEGITELRGDYDPQLTLFEEMLRKGFFVEDNGTRSWNSFVEAVLRCALFPQSRLRLEVHGGPLCCLYFRYDNMVLLVKKPEDPHYMLYYVPLLPEAIGTLARELKTPELAACSAADLEARTVQVTEPAGAARELPAVLERAGVTAAEPLILGDGQRMGTYSLCRALLRTAQGSVLAAQEERDLRIAPAEYYKFLEDVSHWIVATHGASIAAKGAGEDE